MKVNKIKLVDWAFVQYPKIEFAEPAHLCDPECSFLSAVFADPCNSRPVSLFGRAFNHPHADEITGEFTDGHRISTSRICKIEKGKVFTENSIYTLETETINETYKNWCEENGVDWREFDEIEVVFKSENDFKITADTKILHICENCGKEELLTSEEGFRAGWDYPPRMGFYKIVSPRICGNCEITTTLWWEMTQKGTPFLQLSEKHLKTFWRIYSEPESILP